MTHYFLAIDIGAESGRIILGSLISDKLELKEIHRFANGMLRIRNKFYWNIGSLYKEIIKGLGICVYQERVQPEAIGIDTWGGDFGLLTRDGTLLGLPYAYRDTRTQDAVETFTSFIKKDKLYELTGTQCVPYNTVFQLQAAKKYHPELINGACDLLFMPDLLTYFLTGKKKTEVSIASTTQLYNPMKKNWEKEVFNILDINIDVMKDIVEAGSIIGYIDNHICRLTGINSIPVLAVATHDTNSAICAIPAQGDNWAFISSGTWSLMGVESHYPIVSNDSFQKNFSNESGAFSTFNILKNHMGLWIVQQCKEAWKDKDYTYDRLTEMALQADEFIAFINVDDVIFFNPDNMYETIVQYIRETNQRTPDNHGQIIRIILESLALKYRETSEEIVAITGRNIDEIYITGGGVKNQLLSQFTANATGRIVKTVLAEGASVGNIMMQSFGLGYVSSLSEIRKIIKNSYTIKVFEPNDNSKWENAFILYQKVIKPRSNE